MQARLLFLAIIGTLAFTVPAGAQSGEKPSPYLDNGLVYPEDLQATISVAVDDKEGRVYIRLVLKNTGENTYTVPVYLERYPFYESATLLLRHDASGKQFNYPGPISVVWSRPGPEIAPTAEYDTTLSLTKVWFEADGEWTAVWRRAVTRSEGNQVVIDRWVDASNTITFTLPPGFTGASPWNGEGEPPANP